jgi:hypothetical protein
MLNSVPSLEGTRLALGSVSDETAPRPLCTVSLLIPDEQPCTFCSWALLLQLFIVPWTCTSLWTKILVFTGQETFLRIMIAVAVDESLQSTKMYPSKSLAKNPT